MLQIKNLKFSYQDGSSRRIILDDVNQTFNESTLYSIVGQSGSGKTTLLSLMAALDVPEEGEIIFNNENIQKIGLNKYRKNNVSMVYQNFNLIPYMSALQNVMVAQSISDNTIASKESALKLLDSVGINEEKSLRNIKKLSGGEQQRVAIARALSTNSNIIIADEPTGNLDNKTQNEIIDIFKEIAHDQNKCVIVVTHSNSVAKQCDVQLKLNDGTIQ